MESNRFSDQIREAINASGLSRYAICKVVGLDQGAMSRFMAGKCGMELATLDKIADLLGLQVTLDPKKAKVNRGKHRV